MREKEEEEEEGTPPTTTDSLLHYKQFILDLHSVTISVSIYYAICIREVRRRRLREGETQ